MLYRRGGDIYITTLLFNLYIIVYYIIVIGHRGRIIRRKTKIVVKMMTYYVI